MTKALWRASKGAGSTIPASRALFFIRSLSSFLIALHMTVRTRRVDIRAGTYFEAVFRQYRSMPFFN